MANIPFRYNTLCLVTVMSTVVIKQVEILFWQINSAFFIVIVHLSLCLQDRQKHDVFALAHCHHRLMGACIVVPGIDQCSLGIPTMKITFLLL